MILFYEFDLNLFIELVPIPEENYDDIDYILIPEGLIKTRVEKLAQEIYKHYCGDRLEPLRVFVIMNGAFQFYSDLLFYLKKIAQYKSEKLYFEADFIKIKSYINTESRLESIDDCCISEDMVKGQDILIVEDIFDTGSLMSKLLAHINKFEPNTVECAILMHKENPKNLKHNFAAKFTAFSVPGDKFVMGYGIDYNEKFRELPHICIITKTAIDKYRIETD